jgi:hypothetical protein
MEISWRVYVLKENPVVIRRDKRDISLFLYTRIVVRNTSYL